MQEAADDAKREAHAAIEREAQAQARAEALDAARAAEQRKSAELQGDVNALMADGDVKVRCAHCVHVNLPCFDSPFEHPSVLSTCTITALSQLCSAVQP